MNKKIFCYTAGALGASVSGLIQYCTVEGTPGKKWNFKKNSHQENFSNTRILKQIGIHHVIPHDMIDIEKEKQAGNIIITPSSRSVKGKLLILTMRYSKIANLQLGLSDFGLTNLPTENNCSSFHHYTAESFGEKIEIHSDIVCNWITDELMWFLNADHVLDILDFWENPDNVVKWIRSIGLTPLPDLIFDFCFDLTLANNDYYRLITKVDTIFDDVINCIDKKIDLSFYETALIHAMLRNHYNVDDFKNLKLLTNRPTSTMNFIDIFSSCA